MLRTGAFAGLACRPYVRPPAASLSARHSYSNMSSSTIPQSELIEEELLPDYKAEDFYPVKIGDVYNSKYRIVQKLGFGRASTVWLASVDSWWHRLSSPQFVALKVGRSNPDARRATVNERRMSERLKADVKQTGARRVRQLLDSFELTGAKQDQQHLCLVHEAMREPASLLQQRIEGEKLPTPYVKYLVRLCLEALEYLDDTCRVVHTESLKAMANAGTEHKVAADGRFIYTSNSDFGFPRAFRMLPRLSDFGLAYPGERPEALRRVPIQPAVYQAPEVILGVAWSYKADIWNLGCLIWNWMENRDLFLQERVCSPETGRYEARRHLVEMYNMLGPTPRRLINASLRESRIDWPHAEPNLDGVPARNPAEYHGGPFFDEEGTFLHMNMARPDRPLQDTVTTLDPLDKGLFLDFVFQMLKWQPEERTSAKELLTHPWLEF